MVFLINADARNIISTQATFITRYEDSDKKPVRYLYITAYKLNMEKIGLTSRLGKVNIMMLKRANFFSASPKMFYYAEQCLRIVMCEQQLDRR